jgi:protein SCO1/2
MSLRHIYLHAAAAIAFAALVGALLAGCQDSSGSAPVKIENTPSPFAGGGIDKPFTEPDFTLHDERGQEYTLSQYRGKLVLVTFIYSHCPDVCPLITANLNQALRDLGPKRDAVRVLAVSVDPKGDTSAAVRRYRKERHLLPEFIYLIGTRAELLRVWKAYHVAAVDRDPELVDHSAYTVLIDQQGKARVLYDARVQARDVIHDARVLLK